MEAHNKENTFHILLADDDDDVCLLIKEAVQKSSLNLPLTIVHDGDELMAYLRRQGPYKDAQRPSLILLDLAMPRKNGREALQEIKVDPKLRTIPVVVITISQNEEDIKSCYEMGANSYIIKPSTQSDLVRTVSTIGRYWSQSRESPDIDDAF